MKAPLSSAKQGQVAKRFASLIIVTVLLLQEIATFGSAKWI